MTSIGHLIFKFYCARLFSDVLIDRGAYSLSSVWVLPAHNGTVMHRAGTRCGLFACKFLPAAPRAVHAMT